MGEKWQELYSDSDIKKIQEIELDSLTVFSDLCKKLNIEYYLYGGSMLGAIKYNGFVPWDDDLDIALMRHDYDKLIKEGPSLLPDDYELQEPSINKITPYPYIKFRRKDTTMVEYAAYRLKMNHGVYFDVYPIDNIPDDEELYKHQHRKLQRLVRIFLLRQRGGLTRPVTSLRLFLKAVIKYSIYCMLQFIPHDYLVSKMYNTMVAYNNITTKRQGNYFYPRAVNYFDGILPAVEVLFEMRKEKIPKGYEVNLRNRYGDYSILPPEDQRIGHRPYILEIGGYNVNR